MLQREIFKNWIKETLSEATAEKYSGAIETITNELLDNKKITRTIYSITSIEEINKIIEQYLSVPELKQKNNIGNNMYTAALKKYIEYLKIENDMFDTYVEKKNIEDEIKTIESNLEKINETESLNLIKSRIGQSGFKNGLLKKYNKCILCNINIPELLVASHIKPWSVSKNIERLDLNNGLLLCSLHDKLFDLGYISFDISGKIIISDKIKKSLYEELNISENIKINLDRKKEKYINWHRENKLNNNPNCT